MSLCSRQQSNFTSYSFQTFCQLTRCLLSASSGHSTIRVCHPAPCTFFQHHLSLKLRWIKKKNFFFNANSSTGHSNRSYNSNFNMKLAFLFNVPQLWPSSPPPSFAEKGQDNSPASGAGKTGLLCSLLSFQLPIEVRDWKGALGFRRQQAAQRTARPWRKRSPLHFHLKA